MAKMRVNLWKFSPQLALIQLAACFVLQAGRADAWPSLSSADLYKRSQAGQRPTCGYEACPETHRNKLNVHLVPHSHDDIGWLKTVDQYYYRTNNQWAQVGVQYIYDSVIPQLIMDPSKRFIAVEMGFFSRWWNEQDEQMRQLVKRLVNEGRLEFINGGWCMSDEAATNYLSNIEQMTLGLRFLNDTFGACARPKVGWQIDPFGHSSEQASLFGQFGFDGMFFTRESYEDKEDRKANKTLDLIWNADVALPGKAGSIFTNIFRDSYDAPANFCFDVLCPENHLVDNKASHEYNIDHSAERFVRYLREYAKNKEHNHLLIPMGGDFHYSAANHNFKNSDKLIKFIRANNSNINIFYSTPTCYQWSVYNWYKSQPARRIPEKFDDFMPYDSTPTVWWSGYFTSKPSVKLIERETASLLQVSRLISLANLLRQGGSNWSTSVKEHEAKCLMPLWEVLGDLQHHDAITGTAKEHVDRDYIRRVVEASDKCASFIGELRRQRINEYLKKSQKYDKLQQASKALKLDPVFLGETQLCPYLNISQCDPVEANVDQEKFPGVSPAAVNPTERRSANFQHLFETIKQSNLRAKPRSKTARPAIPLPEELETRSVLVNVYNPLARPVSQHDIRLPCAGECDLNLVKVIHLSTKETLRLTRMRIPAGIEKLPFRDALTNYEVLFYANIPPLGYSSYIFEDTNKDNVVDELKEPADGQDSGSSSLGAKRKRSYQSIEPELNSIEDELSAQRAKRSQGDYAGDHIYDLMELDMTSGGSEFKTRLERDTNSSMTSAQDVAADRVIVKFDLNSGMIVGLKRISDGSLLSINQKFGFYMPANNMAMPGAYIFRPNTSEPFLFEKPINYKMYKRKDGSLIEIHQKWSDWIWQTIRVDAKKNYIEFDYIVGPLPVDLGTTPGIELVTRYITNMSTNGIFFTDSNDRQLIPRHRKLVKKAEELGGSIYPVVSTIMLKNTDTSAAGNSSSSEKCSKCQAEAVAIIVDRPQGGTSLHEGQLELLIHRRHLRDDSFGVDEPLNEPGEDGRGLVIRGNHKVYIKFKGARRQEQEVNQKQDKIKLIKLPQSEEANLEFEKYRYLKQYTSATNQTTTVVSTPTYIVYDPIFDDLREESKKQILKPLLTFDRLRMSAAELLEMISANKGDGGKLKTDLALLNNSLPNNIHILTLQPLSSGNNQILIRLENLYNPLTIHPFPDYGSYQNLLKVYKSVSEITELDSGDSCQEGLRPRTEVDLEYLIKRIRIVELEELSLGANSMLSEVNRLNWFDEELNLSSCEQTSKSSSVKLSPRQIKTLLAKFTYL